MKKITLILLLTLCSIQAQVGIGTSTPSSTLDVVAANPTGTSINVDGLLIPRITRERAQSMTGASTSTLVYINEVITGTAFGTTLNVTSTGFYFFNGTLWEKLTTGLNNNWTLTGNSGTTAGTNYIGTTDNVDFRIKTGSTDRWNISNTNNGQLQSYSLGTATNPAYSFKSGTNSGIFSPLTNILGFSTSGLERMRILADGRAVINNNTPLTIDQFSVYSDLNAVSGYSTSITGLGVRADNSTSTGTGLLVSGNGTTAYTLAGTGSGGAINGDLIGSVSFGNNTTSGWGILTAGNNGVPSTITGGGGGSFSGNQWGVFANATLSGSGGTARAAFVGNFNEIATARTVYLGARIGGVNYKVLGTGSASVSTTMETRDGERILFAPEAPENWFFDIGEVTLINGKAEVALDPLFIDCIADSKPFKVFVQGGEDTLGSIRITRNQNNKTFLVEDLGGASNGVVQYSVYAIWKQKENLRFPKYTKPFSQIELKKEISTK